MRWMASLYFSIVMVQTLFLVALSVIFTDWYNYFYDALQEYNLRAVIDLMYVFVFLAAVNIVVNVYRYYLQSYLALKWRRWLTEQFITRWLSNRSYYYL